jgi:hypothetical protein
MSWLLNQVPTSIVDDVARKFGPDLASRVTKNMCAHRNWFYMSVIKLMVPAVVTWLVVQSVAAMAGDETSRWVDILAIALAFLAFATSWYFVVDVAWRQVCGF